MYATCIGLILKGYNVFENNENLLHDGPRAKVVAAENEETEVNIDREEGIGVVKVRRRKKNLKNFMDSIKDGLIDLFKEEEDSHL
jgi:cell division protein FtsA